MYTLRFTDPRCNSNEVDEVGGKNAELGELLEAGVPVPPGFAVTTTFYRTFLEESGIGENIERILGEHDLNDVGSAQSASEQIQVLFDDASLTPELESTLKKAWDELVSEIGSEPAVAVRSSATAEDRPDASFAGQQDTFLNVRGFEAVRNRTIECMASLFSPRSIAYRGQQGFDHETVEASVGIQELADARSAGVMFTVNPANGDRSKARIESNWGLGESVVSGSVTPDSFLVEKPTFEIVERRIQTKDTAIVRAENGTEERSVEPDRREEPSITEEELRELVDIGKQIERHYGSPQDIEWAIDHSGEIYILQSRPETTWKEKEVEGKRSKKTSAVDFLDRNSILPDGS